MKTQRVFPKSDFVGLSEEFYRAPGEKSGLQLANSVQKVQGIEPAICDFLVPTIRQFFSLFVALVLCHSRPRFTLNQIRTIQTFKPTKISHLMV